VGLGLAELAAPEAIARFLGVRDDGENCATIRACGMRELATGVGVLGQPNNAGWLWARLGGDVMDLALLGGALRQGGSPTNVGIAAAAVAGITLLDGLGAQQTSMEAAGRAPGERSLMRRLRAPRSIEVRRTTTVNRPAEELYRYWRDLQNLPTFMRHLESVRVTGERTSHWKARAPAHASVEWDAEIIDDQPNRLIAWRSLEGAEVSNAGQVRFVPAPGGRGTEVHVELAYRPLAGKLGSAIAKLFGEAPEQQVRDELRAFKQVMETGEVTQSDASVHERPHAARPPEPREIIHA
jgi:uncharacterized membrane protein